MCLAQFLTLFCEQEIRRPQKYKDKVSSFGNEECAVYTQLVPRFLRFESMGLACTSVIERLTNNY